MYDKIIIVRYKKKLNLFRHFGKNLMFCSRHFDKNNSRHFGHGPYIQYLQLAFVCQHFEISYSRNMQTNIFRLQR